MKSTLNFHWKDWCWSSNTLATWGKEQTHWKIPWCWERWKAWEEEDNRGWDAWMVSPTQRTSVWAHSRRWWRTGKPGVLQSMGSQTFGHDWVTEEQHKSSKKQFNWKQHVKFGYNVMRIQNCDKHLEFTSHFSIKEPSHTSSSSYLYLIRKPKIIQIKNVWKIKIAWWKCAVLSEMSEVAQSCPTLCDPMNCSLPGSSVHRIFQAIVLEWIAISFSRGSSQPRDWTRVSHIVDRRLTIWAIREVLVEV